MSGRQYLEFKKANCKDCYRCLRNCPVKAIEVSNHQAKIIDERCILCGKCTLVCHQNAKVVHSERADVEALLASGKVIASVAPSFVSSLGIKDFSVMEDALVRLGFAEAQETAIGAAAVVECFRDDLKTGKYRNYITSCCPAVNRLIKMYYPAALKYLSPVVSPMVAHGKIIKDAMPDVKVVFIGPCIAKKREAAESGVIDGVLTFEELMAMLRDKGIEFKDAASLSKEGSKLRARFFPVPRGVIKSFGQYPEGYEYISADGVERCKEVLENIDDMEGMFLELNACEHACINGPCSIACKGGSIKANEEIRTYAGKGSDKITQVDFRGIDMRVMHRKEHAAGFDISEERLLAIMAKTGRDKPENQLNCGACGFDSCRQKAWAVANGFADEYMCLPYMRQKAESLSYEIIENSPNGILVIDGDMRVMQMNNKAKRIWGVTEKDPKGMLLVEFEDPTDYINAFKTEKGFMRKCAHVAKTDTYVEINAVVLSEHKVLFAILKDITTQVEYEDKLHALASETLSTTDAVIKKQMMVAQEIASLLGETTAETKVALLKLKKMLQREESD